MEISMSQDFNKTIEDIGISKTKSPLDLCGDSFTVNKMKCNQRSSKKRG